MPRIKCNSFSKQAACPSPSPSRPPMQVAHGMTESQSCGGGVYPHIYGRILRIFRMWHGIL